VKSEDDYLKPEQFGFSNEDCRHKKVIDMLDENGIKPLNVLKDDPGFTKLKWFSLFRLKTPLEKFSSRSDLSLRSTRVTLSLHRRVKHRLTTLHSHQQESHSPLERWDVLATLLGIFRF